MASIQDLFEIEEVPSSFIRTSKQEIHSHTVFFDEDIGNPAKYRDLISSLYMADEMSEFNLFMNTSGGSLPSCMAIVEAIKATPAIVRAIIVGDCHSAGSIIALHAHEVIVTDSASMMIHTASYSTGGNTHNVQAYTDFSTVYINKILESTYAGFLTDSELDSVKKGVELWLHAEDITKRIEGRQLALKRKHDADVKANKMAVKKKKPVTTEP